MSLTPSQQLLLVKWMESKHISTQCPACNTPHQWSPGDIVAAPVIKPGGMHIGTEVTPMVEIICDNCGHVRFFAAAPIGLYTPRERNSDCGQRRTRNHGEPFTISA